MKALVLENKKLLIKDIPSPLPSEKEALVKVLKAGICNTDLELVKGYMAFEGVPGHEFVGCVVQALNKSWVGKRVVGEINIPCGQCEFCRKGEAKHCPSRDILGITNKNGAFAEFLTLPLANLHRLPDEVSDTRAVFVEPLAAALEILEQIRVRKDESVLVLGDGKLGLLVAQVMRLKTKKVSCLGKHRRKLNILMKKGIETSISVNRFHHKYDIVIEATGKEEGLRVSLSRVKPRGRVILKSTVAGESSADFSKIVVDEIQLIGSRCGPFLKAINLLRNELVDVEEMVDGEFPLGRALEAFSLAQKPGTMKVLIRP